MDKIKEIVDSLGLPQSEDNYDFNEYFYEWNSSDEYARVLSKLESTEGIEETDSDLALLDSSIGYTLKGCRLELKADFENDVYSLTIRGEE